MSEASKIKLNLILILEWKKISSIINMSYLKGKEYMCSPRRDADSSSTSSNSMAMKNLYINSFASITATSFF